MWALKIAVYINTHVYNLNHKATLTLGGPFGALLGFVHMNQDDYMYFRCVTFLEILVRAPKQ